LRTAALTGTPWPLLLLFGVPHFITLINILLLQYGITILERG